MTPAGRMLGPEAPAPPAKAAIIAPTRAGELLLPPAPREGFVVPTLKVGAAQALATPSVAGQYMAPGQPQTDTGIDLGGLRQGMDLSALRQGFGTGGGISVLPGQMQQTIPGVQRQAIPGARTLDIPRFNGTKSQAIVPERMVREMPPEQVDVDLQTGEEVVEQAPYPVWFWIGKTKGWELSKGKPVISQMRTGMYRFVGIGSETGRQRSKTIGKSLESAPMVAQKRT